MGIEFEERDITQNDAWLDELMELGSQATPTTVIVWGEGREVITGFDKNKLTALLVEG